MSQLIEVLIESFSSFLQAVGVKVKLLGRFVERIQEQSNPAKIEVMFGLIQRMIDDNIVKSRYRVCSTYGVYSL